MLDIILAPLHAIAIAKKQPSMKRTMQVLLASSIIFSLISFAAERSFSGVTFLKAFLLLVASFSSCLFLAWLLNIAMSVLTQRGGYYESLTTVAYGFFISSVGLLAFSVLAMIPLEGSFLLVMTVCLSILVLALTFILAIVVTLRMGVELFAADYFTVVMTLSVLLFVVFATIYFVIVQVMLANLAVPVASTPVGSIRGF